MNELRDWFDQSGARYALLKTRRNLFAESSKAFELDTDYVTFALPLTGGSEAVWNERLKSKVRTRTRKGIRCGASTRIGGMELFDDFIGVIKHCWHDLGTPTHSTAFYRSIFESFGDNARIMNLYYENKVVSTAMLLIRENTIHHPFTGTIGDYQPLALNNVLYLRIIEFASELGLDWFDMGRSPVGSGTERFKKPWGGVRIPLYYAYLLRRGSRLPRTDSPLVQVASTVWKFLPLAIANALGPVFIRNVL